MVDEGRSGGAYGGARPWEDRSGRAAGTILATAVAAWYASFAAVLNSTFGRVLMPVVPLRR